MSRFPKYSLRGLEGRRILGVDGRLVLVEGISDMRVYGKFVDDRSRLLPVEDVADTRSNRDALVSMSTDYPEHSFIVDEDLMSLADKETQEDLPENLATTWELNDIESWAFHALQDAGHLGSMGLNDDDVRLALWASRKLGSLRLISKRMEKGDSPSRWRVDFNRCKERMLQSCPRLHEGYDLVAMAIRSQSRDTVSLKRWQQKVGKVESEFSKSRSLQMVAGHDLAFFLYYATTQRKGATPDANGQRDFERMLVNRSLGFRGGWDGLMSGKVGTLLGARKS